MILKRVALFIFCGFYAITVFSQDGKLEFTQKKITNDGLTVYFHVVNITDNDQANQVLSELLNDENIYKGRYFKSNQGKDRFQLYINDIVTAEYVRNILLSQNVDYEFSTVKVDGYFISGDAIPEERAMSGSAKTYITSMGFPKYERSGDKEMDDINYRIAKDKWINENPEEYDKLLEDLKPND